MTASVKFLVGLVLLAECQVVIIALDGSLMKAVWACSGEDGRLAARTANTHRIG